MYKYVDFVIKDYKKYGDQLGTRIIQNIIISRLEAKKSVILLLTGESGEGKSYTALKIYDIVNKYYNLDSMEYIDKTIVYTPKEYIEKMNYILNNPEAKKCHVIFIDEARTVVPAKLWHDFINRTIADVNALHRTIKRICHIVVTQNIGDIDKDSRNTVNYYFKCIRPLRGNVKVAPYRLYTDDHDLKHISRNKRKMVGRISNGGASKLLYVKNIEVSLPPAELCKAYDKINYERKQKILAHKMEVLMNKIELAEGIEDTKITDILDYLKKHPELHSMVTYRKGNKNYLNKDFIQMYGLTTVQQKEFHRRFNEMVAGTHE